MKLWAHVILLLGAVLLGLVFISAVCSAQELPDAPAMVKAVHTSPAPPIVKRFSDYRSNRWLLRADFAIRINDAASTYVMDGTGVCPTCRETQLPSSLAKNLPGMLMYSFAVHEGVKYGAELLWRHNHHRLARAVVIADIVGDAYPGMKNWTILSGNTAAAPQVIAPITPRFPVIIKH